MSAARLLVVCGALVAMTACESGIGSGRGDVGFEAGFIELCREGTDAVALRTETGGRLAIEVLDACGATLVRCEAPDLYAPHAVTSIRVSGTDLLVEGCAAPAEGGAGLRATFTAPDAGAETEVYEVALRGVCLGSAACAADGGASSDAGSADAGGPSDAGT